MRGPGRLAEGIALGAVLALLAVIALLLAHGVQQDTVPASIGEQLIGVCGTMAAAWLAVWGIGWQIQEGRDTQESARMSALEAQKIELQGALSEATGALEKLLEIWTRPDGPETEADLNGPIQDLRSCRPVLAATSRVAAHADATWLAVLGAQLQIAEARAELDGPLRVPTGDRTSIVLQIMAAYSLCIEIFPYARSEADHIKVVLKEYEHVLTHWRKFHENIASLENGFKISPEKDGLRSKIYNGLVAKIMRTATPPTERPLT
ncbi:MAG: hypothetical protein ACI807_000451 [Paracoccaceae bacterium]